MKEMCLAQRMKFYENLNKQYLSPNQYVLMRLDGKNFSKFTKKNFIKPFDMAFIAFMKETAKYLFQNISGCCAAYVQSDEITLLLTDMKSVGMEGWFNYRVDKMCSIAASMATAKFNSMFSEYNAKQLAKKGLSYDPNGIQLPVFDCRVWNVPNKDEARNVFLWRQRDCIRNSVLQYAQSFFSHNELMNKNTDEVKEMIRDKFQNDKSKWWESLAPVKQSGTFFFKKKNEYGRNEIVDYCSLLNTEKFSYAYNEFEYIFNDVAKY